VVIPVLGDESELDSLLSQLKGVSPDLEIVVADGARSEEVGSLCQRYKTTLVRSKPGRGVQMNRGAEASRGDLLWFLHADTVVYPESLEEIRLVLEDNNVAGGAFRFRLHQRPWYAPVLDLGVALRCRIFKLPYGDQGIFMRRSVFESLHGFREVPFLEDFDMIRRLKKKGRMKMLSTPIGVSARRWERKGLLRTTITNWLIALVFMLGVSPERLLRWYQSESGREDIGKRESVIED
jgi:rSAM/selenodomain-associated transferase 2